MLCTKWVDEVVTDPIVGKYKHSKQILDGFRDFNKENN